MRIIVIALLLFSVSCKGQSSKKSTEYSSREQKAADTLSVLILKNIANDNYRVLHLSFDESSEDKIQLLQNGSIVANILLPIADVDVKNFSVDQIKEVEDGFELSVNWGGGNDFYGRSFYFEFKEGMFFLNKVQSRSYSLAPKKETSKEEKIVPPIKIDEFTLSKYIRNE